MKARKEKSHTPILAAGGIVLRNDPGLTARIAVVQSRKLATWGLPKGKLAAGEDAMAAARREVLEETGHHVTVHEFLGTLVYETSQRPKVVHFWRMEAADAPAAGLMRDVVAVDWLALDDAIGRLSHVREQVFLEQIGPLALALAERSAGAAPLPGQAAPSLGRRGHGIRAPGAPSAAVRGDDVADSVPAAGAWSPLCSCDVVAGPHPGEVPLTVVGNVQDPAARAAGAVAGLPLSDERRAGDSQRHRGTGGKSLIEKTWGWFRHAALLHRQSVD